MERKKRKIRNKRPIVLHNVDNEQEAYQAFHAIRKFLSEKPESFGQANGAIITFKEGLSFMVFQTKEELKAIKQ